MERKMSQFSDLGSGDIPTVTKAILKFSDRGPGNQDHPEQSGQLRR
jgi:hypothetical protein